MKKDILSGKKFVVVTGPSGSGKTTLVKNMLGKDDRFDSSISATNRDKRENERHGVDYLFYNKKKILEMIKEDRFVEWQEVYKGIYYGTLKSEIDRIAAMGKIALLDVEVFGAVNIKKMFGEKVFLIYLRTSNDQRKAQLESRASEQPAARAERNAKAEREYKFAEEHENDFDLILDSVNGSPEATYQNLQDFLGRSQFRKAI